VLKSGRRSASPRSPERDARAVPLLHHAGRLEPPGVLSVEPAMETSSAPLRRFLSPRCSLYREPHVPGTGSDLSVTTMSVCKPNQTLPARLPPARGSDHMTPPSPPEATGCAVSPRRPAAYPPAVSACREHGFPVRAAGRQR
jgi:hypothetical protein